MLKFSKGALEIKDLDDNDKFKILAKCIYEYGMSKTEIIQMSDYTLRTALSDDVNNLTLQFPWKAELQSSYEAKLVNDAIIKYDLNLSDFKQINRPAEYHANILNKYHISYSLLHRAEHNQTKFKELWTAEVQNDYAQLLKQGFSLHNVLYWHRYQVMNHYTVNETTQYLSLDNARFTHACEFYHSKIMSYKIGRYRKDLVSHAVQRLQHNESFTKQIKLANQSYIDNTSGLTLEQIGINFGYPYNIIKEVVDYIYGHKFTLELVGKSSYIVGKQTLINRYGGQQGVIRHYHSVAERTKQTNYKRYGYEWASSAPEFRRKIGDATLRANKQKSTQQKRRLVGERNGLRFLQKELALAAKQAKETKLNYAKNLQKFSDTVNTSFEHAKIFKRTYYENGAKFFIDLHNGLVEPIMFPDTNLRQILKYLHILKQPLYTFSASHNNIFKFKKNKLNLSENEMILYNLLMSIPESQRPKFITGDRQQLTYEDKHDHKLHRYELDFYFPELKIGVEINPSRYHAVNEFSTGDIINLNDNHHYHHDKFLCAKDHGIKLIQLFQYDIASANFETSTWQRLKSILRINQHRVFARKTIVSEVNFISKSKATRHHYNEFKQFFEDNHHGGYQRGQLKYELRDNKTNELYAAAIFSKSRLKEYDYELTRLAFKNGVTVVGGLSKIVTHFFVDHPDVNTLMTYSDNNWGTGHGYEASGFSYVSDNYQSPIYISQNEVNGCNSTYSYQIKTPWGAETGVIGQDRKLKHLSAYDRKAKNFNLEQYIETELTHKGYAKEFKEENGREIQSSDDVLNTHKGYDRVFTAGSSKWVARREDFIK